MSRVTMLMSKDPVHESGGDVAMTRLIAGLAAESFDVDVVCLSNAAGTAGLELGGHLLPVVRVPKPAVAPMSLLVSAVRHRRSLAHARFDTPALRATIRGHETDTFLTEHSYMAESFLHSELTAPPRLVVSTDVSEAAVWRATRGALGRVEAPRLLRDELRVARAAAAVGTYDADEARYYRQHGITGARWLDLSLPPGHRAAVVGSPRRLVLMGTRDWPPNQEAFEIATRLWPRISAGIDGAELCVIGAKKPGAPEPMLPEGMRDLGFVDDLDDFLAGCRAMIAPIRTGGGVRVKILDAVRRGLPVVGTQAAIGSLGASFGLAATAHDDEMVERCRRLLLDPVAAGEVGERLYAINAERWETRLPHRAVEALIRAEPSPTPQPD